jgi:hypothetical protein
MRDPRRRMRLIAEADHLLGLGRRPIFLQLAVRYLAKAADRYRKAGMGGMAAEAERLLGEVWSCDPVGRRWSPRMVELALAVDAITKRDGRPPSWQELAACLGVTTGTARDLAADARARGLVTWRPGKARTLEVNRRRC